MYNIIGCNRYLSWSSKLNSFVNPRGNTSFMNTASEIPPRMVVYDITPLNKFIVFSISSFVFASFIIKLLKQTFSSKSNSFFSI